MPPSSAAIEERNHQERSKYFITEVINLMFTPYVIVLLVILIYFSVCGKMHGPDLWEIYYRGAQAVVVGVMDSSA